MSLGVLCKERLETCVEISSRNSSWHTLSTVALAEDKEILSQLASDFSGLTSQLQFNHMMDANASY